MLAAPDVAALRQASLLHTQDDRGRARTKRLRSTKGEVSPQRRAKLLRTAAGALRAHHQAGLAPNFMSRLQLQPRNGPRPGGVKTAAAGHATDPTEATLFSYLHTQVSVICAGGGSENVGGADLFQGIDAVCFPAAAVVPELGRANCKAAAGALICSSENIRLRHVAAILPVPCSSTGLASCAAACGMLPSPLSLFPSYYCCGVTQAAVEKICIQQDNPKRNGSKCFERYERYTAETPSYDRDTAQSQPVTDTGTRARTLCRTSLRLAVQGLISFMT